MAVKKAIQNKSNSKLKMKKSITKTKLSQSQHESNSDSSDQSDEESQCINSRNQSDALNDTSVSNNSENCEDSSYDGNNDEDSATEDGSIIDSCDGASKEGDDGEGDDEDDGSATEDESIMDFGEEEGDEENDTIAEEDGSTTNKTNKSTTDTNDTDTDTTAPSKQQQALANVLGKLLKNKKSVADFMNKPNSKSKEREVLSTENKRKKRKQDPAENVLEIVGEDGSIEKVKTEAKPSKKVRIDSDKIEEIEEPRKRIFPVNAKTDKYCLDARQDADVVMEKKFRAASTQGMTQLFNTLEQFRQQSKNATKGNKPRQFEVSAITAGGKAGLIDFLMKKGKGGAGLASKKADRPLFSELPKEEGPLENL